MTPFPGGSMPPTRSPLLARICLKQSLDELAWHSAHLAGSIHSSRPLFLIRAFLLCFLHVWCVRHGECGHASTAAAHAGHAAAVDREEEVLPRRVLVGSADVRGLEPLLKFTTVACGM